MTKNDEKRADAQRGEAIAADLANLYDQVVDDYVKVFFEDLTDAPWLDAFAMHVPPGGRILDVGCGPGNFAAYLQKKGFRLSGIDISPKMIEAAKKLVPKGTFEVMNCSKLTYADKSFDGTFVAYSLLHLTKEDAVASILEFHRTLVDGGVLSLMMKEGTGEHDLPASLAPGKTCYVLLWDRQEIRAALEGAGFEIVHTDVGPPTSEKELQFQKLLFVAKKRG
jgi:ubiquinone/menaquinone biosynthesis C-methylase UbiE